MRKTLATALLILLTVTGITIAEGKGLKPPVRKPIPAQQLTPAEQAIAKKVLEADALAKKAKLAGKKARAAQKAAKAQLAAMKARVRAAKAQERAELAAARAANATKASEEYTTCVDECVGQLDEDECADVCTASVE
jgi:hypothetical protein